MDLQLTSVNCVLQEMWEPKFPVFPFCGQWFPFAPQQRVIEVDALAETVAKAMSHTNPY